MVAAFEYAVSFVLKLVISFHREDIKAVSVVECEQRQIIMPTLTRLQVLYVKDIRETVKISGTLSERGEWLAANGQKVSGS